MTWGMLGWDSAVRRLLGATLLAFFAGVAVGLPSHPSGASSAATGKTRQAAPPSQASKAKASTPGSLLRAAAAMCAELTPPLLLGVVLTELAAPLAVAARGTLPPLPVALSSGAGGAAGALLGRSAAVAAALPLQACEHSVASYVRGAAREGCPATASLRQPCAAPRRVTVTVARGATALAAHGRPMRRMDSPRRPCHCINLTSRAATT